MWPEARSIRWPSAALTVWTVPSQFMRVMASIFSTS